MDRIFRIGSFTFQLICTGDVVPPDHFMKFMAEGLPEYTYEIETADVLPKPEGRVIAQRPDLTVFQTETGESRLIGVKGRTDAYACYEETGPDRAHITLAEDEIVKLHIDPVFTSLLALERRLTEKSSMVLHCAYTVYKGEAILFSAPSETGKTTQANLWEKYRGSRTVNGDRALLEKKQGRWVAQGWPVCGTSEVCCNEEFPVRDIVMLSQAPENRAVRLTPGQAFQQVYGQITVNRWNVQAHLKVMDLIEDLSRCVPFWHLGCTISEEAVICLEQAMKQ